MDLPSEPPTVDEYVRLRREAGLTVRTKEQARPALKNSWLWVTVRIDGQAVAMGRVIGDGGWYFHIADMATLPGNISTKASVGPSSMPCCSGFMPAPAEPVDHFVRRIQPASP